MPEHPALTEDTLLTLFAQARNPLSLREIASTLGLRHAGRRTLAKLITQLKRQGRITEFGGGRFALSDRDRPEKGSRKQRDGRQPDSASGRASVEVKSPPLRSDPNLVIGRLVAHRDGYAFVVPETPRPDIDGDLFIPPDQSGDAMHGDRVMARIERRDQRRGFTGRNAPSQGPRRAEGRIVKVLDRVHATVVGLFKRGPRGNVVLPFESRILQEIIIPPGDEIVRQRHGRHAAPAGTDHRVTAPIVDTFDGAVVDVEITRFPRGGVAPAGRVIEVLGRPDEFGVDVEIMIRKHHLPHRFGEDVINEAETAAKPVSTAETDGRRDFRDLPIVTIDGETARDFDDAVYVERRPHGWYLQVHIADVAHYVQRNSALDREARLRGTSVYFPDRAVPMLPEELSNGICSLNPREDRLVQSALLEFDHDGVVTAAEFTPGVIRSVQRMTYTDVNRVIQGDAEATEQYAALAERFRAMRDLALVLNARRTRRGSMDFDLPEPLLTFDDEGRITGIVRSERNIAHRLIEEFMLAANQAVAKYLEDRGFTSLHRVHEKPDLKKVLEFEELARAFGYSLGVPGLTERRVTVKHGGNPPARGRQPGRGGRKSGGRQQQPMMVSVPGAEDFPIKPQHYQRLTQKIAGKPEERILSYLMLRSLKQARYTVQPLGHFALAFDQYTHFTSPIRRYPDLIVHRILKWAMAHPDAHPGDAEPYTHAELSAIALETSESERRAEGAERELMAWKTARFMEQHLGEEYDALVISVQKFGFFVELTEIFVEGLVPISHLEIETAERCLYREQDHTIVCGRPPHAQVWKLGDRVRVRAERIDPMRRRVEFALVESSFL